ncbi:hypothetical protein KC614_03795 [candidate division WWE3 bacterium]|uniref:DUF5667 domain-containing protein n=1 Tax=candidate division WWE3 bacterium TaxID=2053526 RepID=A0A955LKR8_UNCKA|nr:hypothetical protein [candidate division WWE3 bacterium]
MKKKLLLSFVIILLVFSTFGRTSVFADDKGGSNNNANQESQSQGSDDHGNASDSEVMEPDSMPMDDVDDSSVDSMTKDDTVTDDVTTDDSAGVVNKGNGNSDDNGKSDDNGNNVESPVNLGVDNRQQNMNQVANQVQMLLQERFQEQNGDSAMIMEQNGIGEQVREVAQEQLKAQERIQASLGKVEARQGLMRWLLGPNYQAINQVRSEIDANQERVTQLQQLMKQTDNEGDAQALQETVQLLLNQNLSLQDELSQAEEGFSVLGWLFKLFG